MRGYCVSDAVARRLVESAPGKVFEVEIKTKRLGAGRELVYEESDGYLFSVERHGDRWLIAGFSADFELGWRRRSLRVAGRLQSGRQRRMRASYSAERSRD